MKNVLYMAVTPDKYELPLYVADSVKELAEKFNTNQNVVLSSISHKRGGNVTGRKFVRVRIEE